MRNGRVSVSLSLFGFICSWALVFASSSHADNRQKPNQIVMEVKGYAIAAKSVLISPQVAGVIIEMPIVEGQRVKKGDLLARLDAAEQEAALRLAQAELKLAQAGVAKAKEGASKADMAMAVAKVEIAEAKFRIAKIAVERTVIRAPYDGTVMVKHAELGCFVSPTSGYRDFMVVCEVADMQKMELEVEIVEKSIGTVAIGQPCQIQFDAFPGRNYSGKVDRILPVANMGKATISIRVRIDVPPNNNSIRPQMGAVVKIMAKD